MKTLNMEQWISIQTTTKQFSLCSVSIRNLTNVNKEEKFNRSIYLYNNFIFTVFSQSTYPTKNKIL